MREKYGLMGSCRVEISFSMPETPFYEPLEAAKMKFSAWFTLKLQNIVNCWNLL